MNKLNPNIELLITETDEIITLVDYIRNFNELKKQGCAIGNAESNLEYSIKIGLIRIVESNLLNKLGIKHNEEITNR